MVDRAEQFENEVDNREDAPRKIRMKTAAERRGATKKEPTLGARVTPVETVDGQPVLVNDPEFIVAMTIAASGGMDFIKTTFRLREPGDLTRTKVGECLARLAQRLAPMQPGPISDVVQICLYLGVWVATGREEPIEAERTN